MGMNPVSEKWGEIGSQGFTELQRAPIVLIIFLFTILNAGNKLSFKVQSIVAKPRLQIHVVCFLVA